MRGFFINWEAPSCKGSFLYYVVAANKKAAIAAFHKTYPEGRLRKIDNAGRIETKKEAK